MRIVLVVLIGFAALVLSAGAAMAQSAPVTVVITDVAPRHEAVPPAEPPSPDPVVQWSVEAPGTERLEAEPAGLRLPEGGKGAGLVLLLGALGGVLLPFPRRALVRIAR